MRWCPSLRARSHPASDQFATVAFALATRTHAEGIQVKLRRFRFGGDTVATLSGLTGVTEPKTALSVQFCGQL